MWGIRFVGRGRDVPGLKPDSLAGLNAEAEASAYLRGKGKGGSGRVS
jgi:hypothetical protein